jgi:hypothetical protein
MELQSRPNQRRLVSEELIADRLRCMLAQIRSGRTKQVLLHTLLIANMLNLAYPQAQTVRNSIYEALTLFLRGNASLAGRRLQAAIECFAPARRRLLPIAAKRLRSRAARA